MFNPITTETAAGPVVTLNVPEILGDGVTIADVTRELRAYASTPRILINMTALRSIANNCGMAFVQFLQQRGHTGGFRTCVYGVDAAVRKSHWASLFMFVEARENATTEEEALTRIVS